MSDVVGSAYVEIEGRPEANFEKNAEGRIGGPMKGLATKAAAIFATAFAGAKLFDFGKGAIDAASDLSEATSKVSVVFGGASSSVLQFSQDSAKAFGISKAEALGATGTFGNLLRSVGLSEDKAASFSTTFVGLASDLASFNNTSTTDALDALRAGLTGETEPLKRYGVNINDALLKQKAFELGLSDGKSTLDSSAKAQASYALIMEQTALSQGDFARTSGGLANQQRILSAQFDNVKARIGSFLIPAMTKVISFLATTAVPALGDFAGAIGAMVTAFLHANDGITSSGLAGTLEGFGIKARHAFDAVVATVGPVLDRLVDLVRSGIGTVGEVLGRVDLGPIAERIGAVAGAIGPIISQIVDGVHSMVFAFQAADDFGFSPSEGILGFLINVGFRAREVIDFIQANWPKIKDTLASVAKAAIAAVVTAFDGLRSAAGDVVSAIRTVFDYFNRNRDIVVGLAGSLALVGVAFAAYTAYVKVAAVVSKAYAAVQLALNAVMSANPAVFIAIAFVALGTALFVAYQRSETFRKVIDKIAAVFMDDVVPALVDFGKTAGKVFEAAAGAISDAVGEIIRVVSVVVDTVSALWSRFGDNILQVVHGAFDGFVAVVQGAIGIVTGIIDVFVGVFTGDWHQVWDGLSGIVQAAWDAVKGVIGAEIEIVKGIFGGLVDAIAGVWGPIWDGLSAAPAAALGAVADAAKLYLGLLKAEVDLVLDGIGAAFRALPGAILATIVGLASAAKGIGEAIINSIGDGLGAVGGIIGDVVGTFADGLKNVVDKIVLAPLRLALNTMAHGLASVNIPGVGRAFDAASSTIENLSDHLRLAQGGLVYGPVRAIVGDNPNANRDPEVVSPLSDLRAIIAGELRSVLGAGGSGAQPLVLQAVLHANAPIYGVDDLEVAFNDLVVKIANRARAQGALRG